MSDNPWATSPSHDAVMPVLTLVDDVYEGTLRLRSKHRTYLPQFHAEEDDAYIKRVQASVLFNATRRTVTTTVGKLMRRPPALEFAGGDTDPMRAFVDDVDLQGNALHVVAKRVAERMALDGVTFVLTDYPDHRGATPISRAQHVQLGLRPYLSHIYARDLIGWRHTTVGGVEVPTQVRWIERTEIEDGLYGVKQAERLRILTRPLDGLGNPIPDARVRFEVWERELDTMDETTGRQQQAGAGGMGQKIGEGEIDLTHIPIVAYYAHRTGFFRGRSQVQDLALENIRHFQARSAHDRGIDVGQYAMLAVSGIDEAELLTVGPFNAIRLGSDGDAKWVEISGAALDAGQRRLTEAEKIMAIEGGSQLHSETRAAETAMAKMIDQAEQDAVLGAMAESIEDSLNISLAFMAEWAGLEAPVATVNKDFNSLPADPAWLREMRELYKEEVISRRTLQKMLVRAEALPDDFDPVAEEEEIMSGGFARLMPEEVTVL
ncbi:DUF4055 domain-containing protein [soil metagenome]